MAIDEATGLIRGQLRNGGVHWSVRAIREVNYDVVVSRGLLDMGNSTLSSQGHPPAAAPGSRRLVIIDEEVDANYGTEIRAHFAHHSVRATFHTLEAHEMVKNWDSVNSVIHAITEAGLDRRSDPIIAIGGGVLLDIVGFAASIYRRNTPYVRIPTTLIGLVDAGVGVKTGVNFGEGKNKVGSYAAPSVTYVDRGFLGSLDRRHLSNGLAEILKLALIKSPSLMALLDNHGRAVLDDGFAGTSPALANAADRIIEMSIHSMLEELQPNLWETNLDRCVDYGHTFSPTIEMRALPELLHGEAVSIDMALSSVVSMHRGLMTRNELTHVLSTMQAIGLPIWDHSLEVPGILHTALADTVRHRGGMQRVPLPVGIGDHKFANDLSAEELERALRVLRVLASTGMNDPASAIEAERNSLFRS